MRVNLLTPVENRFLELVGVRIPDDPRGGVNRRI
jgi:hypothetical protein